MNENEDSQEARRSVETISQEYLQFLINYESGNLDEWRYAQDLGDGVVTIAHGVVIKDGNNYPLTKEVYNYYVQRARDGQPLTDREAYELTVYRLQDFIEEVNRKAREKGWVLNQNQFDALVDMAYNIRPDALDFRASELLATGDLTDEETCRELRMEILETCAAYSNDEKQWLKNLVERRMDIILIAQGGELAYTRNFFPSYFTEEYQNYFAENFGFEGYFDEYSDSLSGNWNTDARQFLLESGLMEGTVDQYEIQQVRDPWGGFHDRNDS